MTTTVKLDEVVKYIRSQIEKNGLVDLGPGLDEKIAVSREKVRTAQSILESEGYPVFKIVSENRAGNKTAIKVIAKPGTTQQEAFIRVQNMRAPKP